MVASVDRTRRYDPTKAAVFRRTKERFGALSNMAAGFPLTLNGIRYPTAEHLYQVCRYPHNPTAQQMIVRQPSPMTAKMKAKLYLAETRPDWDGVRVVIMRWCLQVKLAQHPKFGDLLLETAHLPIVEESRRDKFWGAIPDGEALVGVNALGRLLMELRDAVESGELTATINPPAVSNLLLLGHFPEPVHRLSTDYRPPTEGTRVDLGVSSRAFQHKLAL